VADEAIVLGRLLPPEPRSSDVLGEPVRRGAAELVARGAAVVEVPMPEEVPPSVVATSIAALVTDLGGAPVVVATSETAGAEAALAAGAAAVLPTAPPSAGLLAAIAAVGAGLVLPVEAWPGADLSRITEVAVAASAAGVPSERLLIDVGLAATLGPPPGLPLLATDPRGTDPRSDEPLARGQRSAGFALAIAGGARLLRTTDPRTARRTSVTLAAVRRARMRHHRMPA
jgi:hypothetical protein